MLSNILAKTDHPATHTLPSTRGTDDLVNSVNFWKMLIYCLGKYVHISLNITQWHNWPVCLGFGNVSAQIRWWTQNMELGEIVCQPTFLSSISTVFSHQKWISGNLYIHKFWYVCIYIYLYIYIVYRHHISFYILIPRYIKIHRI